jgi:cell division protein FtsB
MAKKKATRASLVVRGVIALAALGVGLFAVQGGEWGTVDLIRQKSRLVRVRHEVDSLSREVDSLKKYRELVLTDPVTQERIAREEFGMVRGGKEMLYRYTEPDSVSGKEKGAKKR